MIMLKITLLLVKNMFFGLNEGISEKVVRVSQKYTAGQKLQKSQNFMSLRQIAYKLTSQKSKPVSSVNICINYVKCLCKFQCRGDNTIKNNEVKSGRKLGTFD